MSVSDARAAYEEAAKKAQEDQFGKFKGTQEERQRAAEERRAQQAIEAAKKKKEEEENQAKRDAFKDKMKMFGQ